MTYEQLITQHEVVLIDFFAEWCGPCKMMTPILKKVKEDLGDSIKIFKIDIDKSQHLAASQQVQSVPTIIMYKNGQQIFRQSGVVQASTLMALVN
jgi:thioredoxin 1